MDGEESSLAGVPQEPLVRCPGWLHNSIHPDTAEDHIRHPELDEVASTNAHYVCRKSGDEPPITSLTNWETPSRDSSGRAWRQLNFAKGGEHGKDVPDRLVLSAGGHPTKLPAHRKPWVFCLSRRRWLHKTGALL
jgi:hypothetical protein